MMVFKDRIDAGRQLAKELIEYKHRTDTIVIGIPRGGVEIAFAVAEALVLPLDIIIVKKIGAPGNEELAIGAATSNAYYLNHEVIQIEKVPDEYIQEKIEQKQQEVQQRAKHLHPDFPSPSYTNKVIILIDNGIATGATLLMAIQIIQQQDPKNIIVAIPVAPQEMILTLEKLVTEVICLEQSTIFFSISQFYDSFTQVSNEQVKEYLNKAQKWSKSS